MISVCQVLGYVGRQMVKHSRSSQSDKETGK